MTTINTWPDPARPGVPLNPGAPGAHWLKGYTEDAWMYDGDGGWYGPGYSHQLDAEMVAARYSYLGPCLTLDEAAALQARVAELEKALGGFACVCTGRCEDMEWLPADNMQCASRAARAALEGKKDE